MNGAKLEHALGYVFKNKDLLKEGLTHRSYLNENPSWGVPHNERLEFLGDAALELAVTEALFHRFPEEEEGKLTALRSALVNFQMLGRIARALGVEEFVLLSRGEAKDVGRAREVILANTMEALIGAIYLDGGYDATKHFVERHVLRELEDVLRRELYRDPKSVLQERVQADRAVTPTYKVVQEEGPDHAKVFTVCVYIGDECVARGSGASKQDAEVDAARRALGVLTQ